MKNLQTYIPIMLLVIIFYYMNDFLFGKIIIGALFIISLIAKFKRKQQVKKEVEYDERIEANITKWSLKTLYFLNSLLMVLLLIDQAQLFSLTLNRSFVLIYLAVSFVISFYIIPMINKKF